MHHGICVVARIALGKRSANNPSRQLPTTVSRGGCYEEVDHHIGKKLNEFPIQQRLIEERKVFAIRREELFNYLKEREVNANIRRKYLSWVETEMVAAEHQLHTELIRQTITLRSAR